MTAQNRTEIHVSTEHCLTIRLQSLSCVPYKNYYTSSCKESQHLNVILSKKVLTNLIERNFRVENLALPSTLGQSRKQLTPLLHFQ